MYRADEIDASTLRICDRDNLCGVVRFDEACEEHGLRPVFGAELILEDGTVLPLLIENAEGWRNLCRLITAGQAARPKGEAALSLDALERIQSRAQPSGPKVSLWIRLGGIPRRSRSLCRSAMKQLGPQSR